MAPNFLRFILFLLICTSYRLTYLQNVVPFGLLRPVSPTQAQSQVHAQVQSSRPPLSARSQFQQIQTQLNPTLQPLQPTSASNANISQRTIPKSRTVGMLSNLRSNFRRSRSSLNIEHKSRKSSISSSISASTNDHNLCNPTEITTPSAGLYTYGYHTIGYWAGRFSSTHDSLHNELLEASLGNEDQFQAYVDDIGNFPDMAKTKVTNTINVLKTSATESNLYREDTPPEQLERRRFTTADEDARCKRVFEYLLGCCGDDSAKKSLFAFQLQYARIKGKPELLPEGGRMEPLLERLGRRVEGALGKRLSSRWN